MYCEKCGYTQEEETNFCPNCGAKLIRPVEMPAEVKEEPETETAAPVKETEVQPEVKTVPEPVPEKKKSRKPLLFVLLAAVIAAGGWFGYQQLPSTKLAKAMKAAEQYTAQENYDGAVTEYMKALELKPQTDEISEPAVKALKMKSQQLADAGQLDEAIKTAEDALDRISAKYQPELKEFIENLYCEKAYTFLHNNDFQAAKDLLQAGVDKGYGLSDEISEIQLFEEEYTERKYLMSVLEDIAQEIEREDYDSACGILLGVKTDLLHYQSAYGMDNPILLNVEDGIYDKIGVYYYADTGYSVYYGEYTGGSRNGKGIYIFAAGNGTPGNTMYYHAESEWKDDVPQGNVTECKKLLLSSGESLETVLRVQTKNGIFDGEAVYEREGDTYYGTFHDGIPETKEMQTGDGGTVKALMFTENKNKYIFFNDEASYSKQSGMPGYGSSF